MITLHLGDCAAELAKIGDASIDAIVTDPPSGIAFMGKAWDTDKGGRDHWIAWLAGILRECRRVLKPGGHALVWALPRTSHWTATAAEDAGFDVRDVIMHVFGNGFPKSLDVSKAIDKAAGAEREVIGFGINAEAKARHAAKHRTDPGGTTYLPAPEAPMITAPATDDARAWQGWGTALKPAAEHWILARKPLGSTVAACVLEHGTGAINVDACRVGTTVETWPSSRAYHGARGPKPRAAHGTGDGETQATGDAPAGRWPPHLLLTHDARCGDRCVRGCPVREMDEQSGDAGGTRATKRPGAVAFSNGNMDGETHASPSHVDGGGGASRFFPRFRYTPKPSSREKAGGLDGFTRRTAGEATGRAEGSAGLDNPRAGAGRTSGAVNIHPTVKPIDLMRWLVRLITPPGGVVLDPFMGSGTTGVAAVNEGASFVGIERESDYYAIARARIEYAASERAEEPSEDVPDRPARTQGDLFAGF